LVLSGFPRRLNTACVMTSRAVLSVPEAESPSVRKIMERSPISACGPVCPRWNLQSLSLGMLMEIFLAFSLAIFLTSDSFLRMVSLVRIFWFRSCATSGFLCRKSMIASLTSLMMGMRTSVLPSLFLVWLSNTGV